MNYRLLLALFATAALTAITAHVRAADDEDDDDQEYDYFAYFTRAHSNMTFGFRATEGAKVKFGNLGSIPVATVADTSAGAVSRTYSNGAVLGDTLRTPETDGTGHATTPAGVVPGRYQTRGVEVDGNGTPFLDPTGNQVTYVTGDFLAYASGFTRNYSFNSLTQVNNGNLVLNQYSATSQGDGFAGKRNISGGVELQAERLFTDPAKRFRFSLVAGVALNGINSKKSGTVSSTLHILTDTYSFNGALPSGSVFPYTAPNYLSASYPDSIGVSIPVGNGVESSPLLAANPTRNVVDVEDGAEVTGVWEVKGSYLVLRIGPEISGSVTPNLSFSASAGFAAAYVGSTYSAVESAVLTDPTLLNSTITTGLISSDVNKFLPGYYANLDAAWAVNERTGFYAGVGYESFGDYSQTLVGRTARIDLGGSASVRGGLNIKF